MRWALSLQALRAVVHPSAASGCSSLSFSAVAVHRAKQGQRRALPRGGEAFAGVTGEIQATRRNGCHAHVGRDSEHLARPEAGGPSLRQLGTAT